MKFEYYQREAMISKMCLLIIRERNYLNKLCGSNKQAQTEAVERSPKERLRERKHNNIYQR
jgi:hypothetical protein